MLAFYTIAIIALLGAMSPGPDFVVVSKNAIAHSRKAGVFTSLGVAVGIAFHSSYCILGIAVIISQSLLLFSVIKYIGAAYLIYIGAKALLEKSNKKNMLHQKSKKNLSNWQAFREGFLVNVLNPKCILFMLSIFTVVIKPNTALWEQSIFGAELSIIGGLWFIGLAYMLTHNYIQAGMNKTQTIITKVLGVFLIALGICIANLHQ